MTLRFISAYVRLPGSTTTQGGRGFARRPALAAAVLVLVFAGTAAGQPIGVRAPGADAISLTDEVKQAVQPLFTRIRKATSITAEAKMELLITIKGREVERTAGTYRIASARPNSVLALLKTNAEETRMVSDGDQLAYVLTPQAYVLQPAPKTLAPLAESPNTPFGPFPEYFLSLTLPGSDSYTAFFRTATGMGISDGKREDLPGTQRIHVRRGDGIVWDMWIREGDQPEPVRLAVDLTGMLVKMNQMNLPEGFRYAMEVNFEQWKANQTLNQKTFRFKPPQEAKEYESLDAFAEAMAEPVGPHPLLGKPAPEFVTEPLRGDPVKLETLLGKRVIVLDFWATWCAPCVEALPKVQKAASEFPDSDVAFYAVNVGEDASKIGEFLKQQELDVPVLLDPEGEIAGAYGADAIPQTVLIGKEGRVQVVHVGFADEDGVAETLREQIAALIAGTNLAEPEETTEP